MKILFDSKGLQTKHHLRDNQRLSALITMLMREQHLISFSSPPDIDIQELNVSDILLITTRSSDEYRSNEIKNIKKFIEAGGGLLLMSNHADWPSRGLKDTREHDAKLAVDCDLRIDFERTFFCHKQDGQRTILSGSDLNQNHPIISGGSHGKPVKTIVTNTSCSILATSGDFIVSISNQMEDKRSNLSPSNRSFAHAIDGSLNGEYNISGRVVAVADSGFIGTDGTSYPGPGLIGYGDNLQFILNTILWLSI